jgi:hypothetical protein
MQLFVAPKGNSILYELPLISIQSTIGSILVILAPIIGQAAETMFDMHNKEIERKMKICSFLINISDYYIFIINKKRFEEAQAIYISSGLALYISCFC